MPVIMLLFVDYANFSKYAEIMLLLFISNLVKIPQNNAKISQWQTYHSIHI